MKDLLKRLKSACSNAALALGNKLESLEAKSDAWIARKYIKEIERLIAEKGYQGALIRGPQGAQWPGAGAHVLVIEPLRLKVTNQDWPNNWEIKGVWFDTQIQAKFDFAVVFRGAIGAELVLRQLTKWEVVHLDEGKNPTLEMSRAFLHKFAHLSGDMPGDNLYVEIKLGKYGL